jgi:hypothetical protein
MKSRTRFLAAIFTMAALYLPTSATPAVAGGCGVWRWPVKTLSDPGRTQVNFSPIVASVSRFRLRSRPSVSFVTDTPRYGYVEHRTWRLRARPIQAKLEDDGDIHLVISVPTAPAKTMIVEFPKRTCVASPFRRPKIAAARQAFVSNCGSVSSSSWLHLAGSVTITGVGSGTRSMDRRGWLLTASSSIRSSTSPAIVTRPRPAVEGVAEGAAHRAILLVCRSVPPTTTATGAEATAPPTRSRESSTTLQVPTATASTETTTDWVANRSPRCE